MRRLRLSPPKTALGVAMAALALGLPQVACPTGECQNLNDCPIGEVCSDGSCIPSNATPNPDPNPTPGPGPGPGGDGGVEQPPPETVQLEFPVAYLMEDPDAPGTLLVPQYSAPGGTVVVDDIRRFDPTAGTFNGVKYDFIGHVDGTCRVDNIVNEPGLTVGETWFVCLRAPTSGSGSLRISYDFQQPGYMPGVTVNQGIALDMRDGNDFGRRLWHARGGAALVSFQIRPNQDGRDNARDRDSFPNLTFESVVSIEQVQNQPALNGETVLVFDRGTQDPEAEQQNGPSLRAIFHDSNAFEWRPHDIFVQPLELSDETHAVLLIDTVDADGNFEQQRPNVMTFEPALGRARYFQYENGVEFEPPTIFEERAAFRSSPPPVSERVLTRMAPSGDAVFYAVQGVPKVWRIPLAPGGDNDVLEYEFGDPAWTPTGLWPISDTELWVSVQDELLFFKVTVIPQ